MRILTLDWETYYDREYSLSKLTTEEYIRDARFEVIGLAYQWDNEPPIWLDDVGNIQLFFAAIDWSQTAVLAHNTLFDGAILHWKFGRLPAFFYDTLSMARPLTGQTVGGSLARLTKEYLPGEAKGTEVINAIGKHRYDFTDEELAAYGGYCMNDVRLCRMLFDKFKVMIPQSEMEIIDRLLRMFIQPVLQINRTLLEDHLIGIERRQDELLKSVGITDPKQLRSNLLFAKLLEEVGVEPPRKISLTTGKETFAFSKTDLPFKELLEHEDERVQTLVAARLGVKSTLERKRTENFLGIADRGLLPVPLGYYAAHTGRAGGMDKINLQNLPARGGNNTLRRAIIAPDGHCIVAGDSSNIEARVLAWLAGQQDLLELFRRGADVYCDFGSRVYGRGITKADKLERFVAKTCVLGLGYGTGAEKLQQTLKLGSGGMPVALDLQEAKRLVDLYRGSYPSIVSLWRDCDAALALMCKGYVSALPHGITAEAEGIWLPNNMAIRYPNLTMTKEGVTYTRRGGVEVHLYGAKLVENIVQALARIVVFDQMMRISKNLQKYDMQDPRKIFRVVLTVHDEVVAVVPKGAREQVVGLMERVMSMPPSWGPDLPVACEVGSGVNYGECK